MFLPRGGVLLITPPSRAWWSVGDWYWSTVEMSMARGQCVSPVCTFNFEFAAAAENRRHDQAAPKANALAAPLDHLVYLSHTRI